MNIKIPQAVKDNAMWAVVLLVSFLGGYYINTTYVLADEHKVTHDTEKVEHADEMQVSQSAVLNAIKELGKQTELNRIQTKIDINTAQRLEKQAYIDEAPESSLTGARNRRLRELNEEKEKLDREYESAEKD